MELCSFLVGRSVYKYANMNFFYCLALGSLSLEGYGNFVGNFGNEQFIYELEIS